MTIEHRLATRAARVIELGLERLRPVLRALDQPQDAMPVVLVTGTNGKGSTSALLASMVRAAGYRVGTFSSPSLGAAHEQITIDGAAIGREGLDRILDDIDQADPEPRLSPFEALTAAAYVAFARAEVDLAVVEVGMGGARDATNVVTTPTLSVLTNVELDHQQWLGETRAAIAQEKAGVMRARRPAICGWLEPDAQAVIRAAALFLAVPLTVASDVITDLDGTGPPLAAQEVTFSTPQRSYRLQLPLAGRHQRYNLALATLAAEQLATDGFTRLDANAIARGAASVHWPARLESFILGDSRVVLDGAHNPASARALANTLESVSYDLLFGTLADKDAAGMLAHLAPRAERVVLTRPDTPRTWDPETIRNADKSLTSATLISEPSQALDHLLDNAAPGTTIVATGSIAFVGQLRAHLHTLTQTVEVAGGSRAR
ncbi:MAG: Mur ligase family protein [Acidobacteriota bacterium]